MLKMSGDAAGNAKAGPEATAVHHNLNPILAALSAATAISGLTYLVAFAGHIFASIASSAGAYVLVCSTLLLVLELLSFIWTLSSQIELLRPVRRPALSFQKLLDKKLVRDVPTVSILIPTCGEPIEVVREAFIAAMHVAHPPDRLRVCLLDDGRSHCYRRGAAGVGGPECRDGRSEEKRALVAAAADLPGAPAAFYLSRPDEHRAAHPAKAGNLNHALASPACADADFVAVLDADMCAEPRFLDATLPHLYRSKGAAYVQSPQAFSNLPPSDPFGHAMQFFYKAGVMSRDGWGSTPNCGTNLVLRTAALRAIGGFQYGLAEDLATAVALQRAGWSSAYCPQALARGLAPDDLHATLVQRFRWSGGAYQVALGGLLSAGSGLPLRHRAFYLNYVGQYLFSLLVPAYLALPLAYAATGAWPLPAAAGAAFAAARYAPYLAAHWAFLLAAAALSGCPMLQLWRDRQRLVCFFPSHLAALAAALAERAGRRCPLPFDVTPKGPSAPSGGRLARLRPVAPQAAATAASLLAAAALLARAATLPALEGQRAALAAVGLLYGVPFFANVLSAALWGVPPASAEAPRALLPPAAVALPALACAALWGLARLPQL